MKNIPERIFLNISKVDTERFSDFGELVVSGENAVTWCHDKVNETDVEYVKKQSPWIREKDRVPIPVIEAIDGNEYGSIDVLGAIQNSYGDYDYYICRYWGYNKEYRWENGIVPDYWIPIPKFNEE